MRYLYRRLGFLLLSLWVALTINFVLPRLMPGNPAEAMLARFQGKIDVRSLHAIELQFGISHAPLWQQYLTYLWNTVQGKFGISLTYYPVKVTTIIGNSLPWTLGLVGLTTVISFVVGTILGIIVAWRRGGVMDTVIPTVTTFTSAIPYFWLALILLYVFAFVHPWFPMGHSFSDGATPAFTGSFILDVINHGILPALTIVVSSIGGWLLGMRNNMIQTLGEDYVVFGEAKGIAPRRLMLTYAARNAILPNVTGFGMALGGVVGGTIGTELVFSYPGIGYQLQQAVQNQDYPLMQAIFLIITLTMLVANFLVDIVVGRLDPRVKGGSNSL